MKNSVTLSKKRLVGFFSVLMILSFFSSCDESDDMPISSGSNSTSYTCVSCNTMPQALVANDNSSRGIYKGVFSEGTIEINVKNNSESISGKIYLNGSEIELRELSSESPKGIFKVIFTGVMNGNKFSMTFRVYENGSNPIITGFPFLVDVDVVKEKSTSIKEVFWGAFFVRDDSGGDVPSDEVFVKRRLATDEEPSLPVERNVGNINIVLSRLETKWIAYSKYDTGTSFHDTGNIVDGKLISSISGKILGNLAGDEIIGIDNTKIVNQPVYLYGRRVR